MAVTTKPEVFIIESLDFEDDEDRMEGRILADILKLSGKTCKYVHIRTKTELIKVLELFTESRFRYLHLSCHGNKRKLFTTLDPLSFIELATILCPHLDGRRLFLSACFATNAKLADALMSESECHSILGPADNPTYGTAAIAWASLYHVMFEADKAKMKHSVLSVKAQEIANMYRIRLNYIRREPEDEPPYSIHLIEPEE